MSSGQYRAIAEAIAHAGTATREDMAPEHVDCSSGACPIDFRESKAAA